MGGGESKPVPPPPGAIYGTYSADNSFIPGGRGRGAINLSDPGSMLPPPQDARFVSSVYKLPQIGTRDLQSSEWKPLANAIPVYVAIPNFGIGTTSRFRIVNGVPHYAVHKLHPLNPQNDIEYNNYFEVPYQNKGVVLVHPLKYAISQFWPRRDTVVFVTNEGKEFEYNFRELLDVTDKDIKLAISLLQRDYPHLSGVLAFKHTEAPHFDTDKSSNGSGSSEGNYTTLSSGPEHDRLFEVLKKQRDCFKRRREKNQPAPTSTVLFPVCGLDSGIDSEGRVNSFDDLSDMPGANNAAVAASSEKPPSPEPIGGDMDTENFLNAVDYETFEY